ncbi:MAG: hypothetical protein IKF01_03735 [Bacilli bacterium]|nr:hypothetical protein [Bacilli bacterium]
MGISTNKVVNEKLEKDIIKNKNIEIDNKSRLQETVNIDYKTISPHMEVIKAKLTSESGHIAMPTFSRNSQRPQLAPTKPISFSDVSSKMSRETYDYIKGLSESDEKICISHISSADLQSIYENGLYLNGRGAMNGYAGIDYKDALQKQDVAARSNGQQSYMQILKQNNQPLTMEGILHCFGYDSYGRPDNSRLTKIFQELHSYKEIELDSAMYYDIDSQDELFRRISNASIGKSEGGNPVDGVLVIKLPSNLQSEVVDRNSEIVQVKNGNISLKPEYIEGFIPVSRDGKIGEISYKNIQTSSVEQIIEVLKSKYNWSTERAIKQLLDTSNMNNISMITRYGNARNLFSSLSNEQIKTAVKNIQEKKAKINYAFNAIENFGKNHNQTGYTSKIIEYMRKNGLDSVLKYVPRETRSILKSMSVEEIISAFDEYILNNSSPKSQTIQETQKKQALRKI